MSGIKMFQNVQFRVSFDGCNITNEVKISVIISCFICLLFPQYGNLWLYLNKFEIILLEVLLLKIIILFVKNVANTFGHEFSLCYN